MYYTCSLTNTINMKLLVKDLVNGERYDDTVSCRTVMVFLDDGIMKAKFFDEGTLKEVIFPVVDYQLEDLPDLGGMFGGSY